MMLGLHYRGRYHRDGSNDDIGREPVSTNKKAKTGKRKFARMDTHMSAVAHTIFKDINITLCLSQYVQPQIPSH